MTRKALIVWGGWDGHMPEQMAGLFEEMLVAEGFDVEVSDTVDSFNDPEALKQPHLIVPCITMGEITEEQTSHVSEAVMAGTGIAGVHGMCDAFRGNLTWQWMTGGAFMDHPGNDTVTYPVHIKNTSSELTRGLEDFTITSEQYYMHVDPCIEVLATTPFPIAEGPHDKNRHIEMPVAWTKRWGEGRVYYNALGHVPENINSGTAREMIRRGFLWAARD